MLVIDRREIEQHPTIPQMIAVPYQSDTLNAGDYAFIDRDLHAVGIERCEISNFVEKLRSGELEKQMERCTSCYSTVLLLIEGVYGSHDGLLSLYRYSQDKYFRNYIYPHTRMDTILASLLRLTEFGIEVFQTPNIETSAIVIRLLYIQRTESEGLSTLFKKSRKLRMPVKYTKNPAVPRLMSLGNRIPENVAIELITKFSSIWGVLNADDKDILEVKGMGKGLLDSIKKGVGK